MFGRTAYSPPCTPGSFSICIFPKGGAGGVDTDVVGSSDPRAGTDLARDTAPLR